MKTISHNWKALDWPAASPPAFNKPAVRPHEPAGPRHAAGPQVCSGRAKPHGSAALPPRPHPGLCLLLACLVLVVSGARATEVSGPSPLFTLDTVLRPAHLGGTALGRSGLFPLDTRNPEWRSIQVQPDGVVRLELQAQPGQQYELQSSSNLVHWVPLNTLTATQSILIFTEPKAPGPVSRFYRALLK